MNGYPMKDVKKKKKVKKKVKNDPSTFTYIYYETWRNYRVYVKMVLYWNVTPLFEGKMVMNK